MRQHVMILLGCALFCCASSLYAAEIFVAAAADLNIAMTEIARDFERHSGHKIRLSFGSSGNFYAQIANRAPYDLFFSADIEYPRKLVAAGLAESGSFFIYAIGRLVVWAPRGSSIDLDRGDVAQALSHPSIKRMAIANPRHAPYGRAAVASLQNLGLYDSLKEKLVYGENVSQTAQFVQSGAADIGIIALALALSPALQATGKHREVPFDSYPSMEQGAIILKRANAKGNLGAVRAFCDWVKGPSGSRVLKRYGFYLPGENEAGQR